MMPTDTSLALQELRRMSAAFVEAHSVQERRAMLASAANEHACPLPRNQRPPRHSFRAVVTHAVFLAPQTEVDDVIPLTYNTSMPWGQHYLPQTLAETAFHVRRFIEQYVPASDSSSTVFEVFWRWSKDRGLHFRDYPVPDASELLFMQEFALSEPISTDQYGDFQRMWYTMNYVRDTCGDFKRVITIVRDILGIEMQKIHPGMILWYMAFTTSDFRTDKSVYEFPFLRAIYTDVGRAFCPDYEYVMSPVAWKDTASNPRPAGALFFGVWPPHLGLLDDKPHTSMAWCMETLISLFLEHRLAFFLFWFNECGAACLSAREANFYLAQMNDKHPMVTHTRVWAFAQIVVSLCLQRHCAETPNAPKATFTFAYMRARFSHVVRDLPSQLVLNPYASGEEDREQMNDYLRLCEMI